MVSICRSTPKNNGAWGTGSRKGYAPEIPIGKSDYKDGIPAFKRCEGYGYTDGTSGIWYGTFGQIDWCHNLCGFYFCRYLFSKILTLFLFDQVEVVLDSAYNVDII